MSKLRSNRLQPKSFVVDKWYRIDESSDPDAQTVVYALSSKDPLVPLKGFLVNGYGIYSDPKSDQILEELELDAETAVSHIKAEDGKDLPKNTQ